MDRIPFAAFRLVLSGCNGKRMHPPQVTSDRKAGDAELWPEIRQLEATLYLREKGSRLQSAPILTLAEQSH